MLIHFIADYTRDPSVQRRFASNPIEVLDAYGVSDVHRELLRAHDREGLLGAVNAELGGIWDQGQKGGRIILGWGPIDIVVKDVTPGEVKVDTATTLTVTGTGFPSTQSAGLVLTSLSGQSVQGEGVHVVTEPSGESTLQATVTISTVGSYTVTVLNTKEAQDEGTWDKQLKVTAGSGTGSAL